MAGIRETLHLPYHWVYVWDEDSKSWTGYLAEFPGCVLHGDPDESLGEVAERLRDVAQGWLRAVRAVGRAVPDPGPTYTLGSAIFEEQPELLQPHPSPDVLNTIEAAHFINLKPSTLRKWRSKSAGPRYVKVGGAVRYLRSDLEQFLDQGSVLAAGGASKRRAAQAGRRKGPQ